MSFSFVVNGHAEQSMSAEDEMKVIQEILGNFLDDAESEGVRIRIDAFNPPSWAPKVQENFQQEESTATEAQGSVGDTGDGAMGVSQTPEGQQTARSD